MLESKIYILILNWNSSIESIRLYFQLLKFTNFKEIYVIDNDSFLSEQEELQKTIPKEYYIQTGKNLGYAGGNNIGIKMALNKGAEFICLLNPDIEISSNFISPLINACISDPNIGAIGPRICFNDSKEIIYSDGGLIYPKKGFRTTHLNQMNEKSKLESIEPNEVDYVNGSAIIIPAETFKSVGYMRDFFFLYFEETEWCMRINDVNKKLIILPIEEVYHKSSKKGSIYNFYMNRNRIWLSKTRNKYFFRTVIFTFQSYCIELIKYFICKRGYPNLMLKGLIFGIFSSPQIDKD
jgi:GT2 family glycosyltransferase